MADLIITGIIDGDIPGGVPKAIELTVIGTVGETLNLGNYSLTSARNGSAVPDTGNAFSPSGVATVGQKIYISFEESGFRTFFGFNPDFTASFINVNGDDVVLLYEGSVESGTLIDVYGELGVDGTNDPWEYADSWAYRSTVALPTAPGTFTLEDWTIPGPDALEDEDNNAAAATPFPMSVIYITESDGDTMIGEGGTTTDTYSVVLSAAPTDTVVITITPDDQTDVGNGAGQSLLLTFTPTNYNQAQTVTVTAVDDGDAGNNGDRLITHTATSNDSRFDSISNPNNLIINISNPDPSAVDTASVTTVTPTTVITPGDITITESDGDTTVSQAGDITDDYTISLSIPPTETVTITITPPTGVNVGSGPGIARDFTFNPSDVSFTQTVSVMATADATASTAAITHTITTTDPAYVGQSITDVTVNIFELLTPGVELRPINTDPIPEGMQTTYDVVLQTTPTDTVSVFINAGTVDSNTLIDIGDGNGPQTSAILTFDPDAADFSPVQTVTVIATADNTANEESQTGTLTHFVFSTEDSDYNAIGALDALVFDIVDPVTIVETDGNTLVAEGGQTDTYEIQLATVPTELVTVTITPDGQTSVGAGPGVAVNITFDPDEVGFDPATDLSQSITVTALNDNVSEGEHTSTITHSVSSLDTAYNSGDGITVEDLDVTISGAAVTIDTGTLATVTEGATTTYQVVLASQPAGVVTVKVTPADAQANVGSGPGVEHTLTFDPAAADFSFAQTVTVTAVADASPEGAHTGVINHTVESTEDAAYDGLTLDSVTVNIVEPGVTIAETGGGTTVSELGATDTYSVVLDSVPASAVTISILTTDGETQITAVNGVAGQTTLTFTPENFNVPQVVTVTGVDDAEVEGVHSGTITHAITTGDGGGYDSALTIPAITATVIDCFLTGTRLLTDEGEKLVEELEIGDRLQTFDGSLERIKWIGIQTCYTHDNHRPLRTYPMRIKAGALGHNRPIRDLYVSPDHALLVEGVLINAGALENGESIIRTYPTAASFVYYHIELERHSLVMAENTPAESYLPQKQGRNTFDNGDEYAERYPHRNMQALMPMRYPRISSKRQLPRYIAKHLQTIAKETIAKETIAEDGVLV